VEKLQMKENNIIQQKSFRFGVNVVDLCRELKEKKKETVLSNQLLRSGTSIGANIEEGLGCQSKKDFYFRITVAYKEARETLYWLKLLEESHLLEKGKADCIIRDCNEILRILGTILKTIRNNSAIAPSHNS
jgi:four helix bundle protein